MVAKKSKKRTFGNLSYQEVQRANSARRKTLRKEDQIWLKDNGLRNVGWENVINLYNKIDEFLEQYRLEDSSLEDLFLEADRIGNKYLSSEDIKDFNQQLATAISEVDEEIDRHFPDVEIEVVDFSKNRAHKSRTQIKKSNR